LSDGRGGFTRYQGRYQTRVYGRLADRIVRRESRRDEPFFLYVSYTAPHHGHPAEPDDPHVFPRGGRDQLFVTPARPDDVKGRFDATVAEAPGARWRDPDFSDKPAFLRRMPPVSAAERAAMLEVTRQRAESLWVVDRQVRRLVRTLRRTGELDRTVVVFTSDNGYYLGEQRMRQGKVYPHEPSLRVPLLVRGPGLPAGSVRHDPATTIDLAPTLAELTGTRPGHRVDGVSLVDVMREGDRGWRRGVLTETGPRFGVQRPSDLRGRPVTGGATADVRFAIGVRTRRYLYVDLATGGKELYDLDRDPQQYDNLARSPGYASVRSRLARVLADLRACTGRECRRPLPRALRGGP
jgi:arylsulfatase A-like enzyme